MIAHSDYFREMDLTRVSSQVDEEKFLTKRMSPIWFIFGEREIFCEKTKTMMKGSSLLFFIGDFGLKDQSMSFTLQR